MTGKGKQSEDAAAPSTDTTSSPYAGSGQAPPEQARELAREHTARSPENLGTVLPAAARQTLDELRVHQIELEVQNEELRRAQEALETSRARYFELYDLAPVGYCTLNGQGLILEVNLTASTLLGVARGALTKQPITRFILKGDQDSYYLHRKQLFETGAPQACELKMVKGDGTEFWANLQGTAAQDADGAPVCRVVLSDITERKRAEEAVRASEERYRTLAEGMAEGLIQADNDDRIQYVNARFCQMVGRDSKELIGKVGYEIFAPEGEGELIKSKTHLRQQGVSDTYESRMKRTDGSELWVSICGSPVCGADGTVVGSMGLVSDVTARKRAEEELRENEGRFRAAFEGLHDAVTIVTEDGEFLDCNQRALEMFRVQSKAHFMGKRPADFSPPFQADGRESVMASRQQIREVLETGGFVRFEWLHQRADGGVFPAEVVLTTYQRGGMNLIQGVIRDITDHKRAEEAARENQERLQRISSMISDIAYSCTSGEDGAFSISWMMGAAERVSGYSIEEIKALGYWGVLVVEEDQPLFRKNVTELPSGAQGSCELRIRHKDGSIVWLASYTECVRASENHDVAVLYGGLVDITKRKRAEEQIVMLAHAIRSINECVSITDTNNDILFVNHAFLYAYGFAEQELIGKNISILRHPTVHDGELENVLRSTIEGGWHGELVNRRKDGSEFPISLSTTPIRDNEGKSIAFIGVAADITDRKRAEEEREKLQGQLIQAQKMEAVGQLAGGVAHDFNNMLQVILGHTDMALGQVDAADPLRADLEEIRRAAQRSADLTRQLLAFARRQTVTPKVLDLNDTIEGMLKMLRRLIGEDIRLSWKPGAGLWSVKMDPSQVDQVLANLCVNARDAIRGVGKVTIETGTAEFDEISCAEQAGCGPGEYVVLAVSDDGCGMDKETLGRVFEPFFTTKGVGEGTGLGLSTVYGVVKQNEGFIDVYSEAGKGTTFTIYLRRHGEEAMEASAERGSEPLRGGSETVLLVEDDGTILRMGTRMLEGLGYRVLAAGTSGEAIRQAEEAGEIDLLITDVVMPEMNGRELAARIGEMKPGLRYLYMSGYTADVIAHRGVVDAGVRFLQKPFTVQALAAKVREALEGGIERGTRNAERGSKNAE